ncbi:hypothetical protein PORY_000557 [Pneumocystis oryctolagi]|uniref:Uncharacterized protein n=1 Tax=Pneumocystis oryctolagi TaxID=42067 RepID=A0ACB7CHA4_9ASCO|nr:hypothetical protein PORY_000557 [Pneumocystis oryctolagi]
MNIGAIIPCIRALFHPSLLVPHVTVESFAHIPYPLSNFLKNNIKHTFSDLEIDIRALVIDKDNCISVPGKLELYSAYKDRWEKLKQEFKKNELLIVSNSSGVVDAPDFDQVRSLTLP